MNKLLLTALILGATAVWAADDSATRQVCVDYTSDLCVEVKFLSQPNSTDEGKFSLKLQTPEGTEAQKVNVDLWMQMGKKGHGSAPLKVTRLDVNIFEVENAWFVMDGLWQVRVNYELEGVAQSLILPVKIK